MNFCANAIGHPSTALATVGVRFDTPVETLILPSDEVLLCKSCTMAALDDWLTHGGNKAITMRRLPNEG